MFDDKISYSSFASSPSISVENGKTYLVFYSWGQYGGHADKTLLSGGTVLKSSDLVYYSAENFNTMGKFMIILATSDLLKFPSSPNYADGSVFITEWSYSIEDTVFYYGATNRTITDLPIGEKFLIGHPLLYYGSTDAGAMSVDTGCRIYASFNHGGHGLDMNFTIIPKLYYVETTSSTISFVIPKQYYSGSKMYVLVRIPN